MRIRAVKLKRSGKLKFWIEKRTFVFSKSELKRLISDKLKRSANLNSKLYKCKIFKKCGRKKGRRCRKKKCRKHNKGRKGRKGKKKRGKKKNKKRNNLGRAVTLVFDKANVKEEQNLKAGGKNILFRGMSNLFRN